VNRRPTRAVEYYGYALIVGIPEEKARRMLPGRIMDYYTIRMDYDMQVNWGKGFRKML